MDHDIYTMFKNQLELQSRQCKPRSQSQNAYYPKSLQNQSQTGSSKAFKPVFPIKKQLQKKKKVQIDENQLNKLNQELKNLQPLVDDPILNIIAEEFLPSSEAIQRQLYNNYLQRQPINIPSGGEAVRLSQQDKVKQFQFFIKKKDSMKIEDQTTASKKPDKTTARALS